MRITLLLLLLALGSFAKVADAGPSPQAAALFEEGRELLQRGQLAQACAKLEASYSTEPGVGAALNAGLAHHKLGHLATAYRWYAKAASLAEQRQQAKRAAFARQQMAELDAAAPKLLVRATQLSPIASATLDGLPVGLGVPLRVDAGRYTLSVRARGYKTWKTQVVAIDGRSITIEVPAWDLRPAVTNASRSRATRLAAKRQKRLILAYATGGVGAAALFAGLGLGLAARSAWSDARELCPAGSPTCESPAHDLRASARTYAIASTASAIVGGAGLGAGVVIWLTARRLEAPSSITFVPSVHSGGGSIVLSRRF